MTSIVRRPTSDLFVPSNWSVTPSSPATYWDKVDEANDTEYLNVENTLGGAVEFGFTVFNVPNSATITNVTIRVKAAHLTGTMTLGYRIQAGGTSYEDSTDYGSSFEDNSWVLTTNPKTGVAWTQDDLNGLGAGALQRIGLSASGVI